MIPFHRPSLGEAEIDEVVATLRSGWLTSGPRTQQFETEFARYVQAPHALAVNSCTAGLHLALAALGLGPGDEVITTPFTFCATVNVILHTGARCVLADIGPDGNIDPRRIAAAIGPRTRAIVPVHLAGAPCDMEAIWSLARKHGLAVVEDAAHAVGARYGSTPIGGAMPETGYCSDAVAFSFYATKNLTVGEGGMVTTHNSALAARMKTLCLHGISHDAWNRYSEGGSWAYRVTEAGFKYNLSDIQSAIGIHQLRKQEEFLARRTAIARRYSEAFSQIEELETPPEAVFGRHSWHLYILRLRPEQLTIGRDEFISRLRALGVACSVHFIPIPLHPAYQNSQAVDLTDSRRSVELYSRALSLPLYPGLSEEEVAWVIRAVQEVVETTRRRVVAASAPVGAGA